MHDSTQILSFVSAYCFFCGNRSATMSSKKKEKGAERLRKSVERKKEVSRETWRRYRENLKGRRSNDEESGEISERSPFPSQMAKNEKLTTYEKSYLKTAVLTWLINSPQTRKLLEELGVILSEEEQSQFKLFRAVINDATSAITSEKSKRNDNSRAAVSIGTAIMLCGESVKASGLTSAASTAFNINRGRIAQSIQRRASALANRESA